MCIILAYCLGKEAGSAVGQLSVCLLFAEINKMLLRDAELGPHQL